MWIQPVSKFVVALSVLTSVIAACGDDTPKDKVDSPESDAGDTNNGGGQGGNTGDNANGNANGNGNTGGGGIEIPVDAGPPATMLGKDVAGTKCAQDTDCAGTGATCAQSLTAGVLGQLIGGTGATGGYCSAECTMDAECGQGGLCLGSFPQFGPGECRKPCKADADCGREGYECATIVMPPLMIGNMALPVPDTCQPKITAVSFTNQVGTACTTDAMCNGGNCAGGDNFPEGYCTGGCFENTDCGTDGVCLKGVYGTGGDCFEGCAQDSDCARDSKGYGCIDADGTKVCVAKADPLPKGVVGSACTDDATCGGGVCASMVGPEQALTPGGYCSSLDCVEDAQCGEGGQCIPTMGRTRCYKGCATSADCRAAEGYTCAERGDDKELVCFPGMTTPP